MTPRRAPRPLGTAIHRARREGEPATLLAAVQSAWHESTGAMVAEEATPVAERDGVVTIACRSATWAQELDLLQAELLSRLNSALASSSSAPSPPVVNRLRFTADAARHSS